MRLILILIIIAVIIKNIEAGVITSSSELRNINNIDTVMNSESNALLEELKLKKSITPKKYWLSKNIPLFKKIPKGFVKSPNKLSKYPDSFYKELYGISKIEEKVKNRMHNLIKTNIHLDSKNTPPPLHTDTMSVEEQIDKDIENMRNIEDIVEISLSEDDDATTEDILINTDQESMEDDNQRLLKEFIQSHTVIPSKSDCHSESSEEKKDLDEFIFMLNSQGPWEDVVDDGDVENTTQDSVAKPRSKRSVNIIEEENMVTTVSEFKFTGQDLRLSNDLYYKNIHS